MLGTVAERPAHNCRGEPGRQGGCSGEREPCSMWSELASLQLPQEMSSPVHCVLIKRAWVFEGVAFGGAWKRGQVLIWLCVGETRARPLDTRTGPADIAGDPAISPPVWPRLPRCRVHACSSVHARVFFQLSPSRSLLQRLVFLFPVHSSVRGTALVHSAVATVAQGGCVLSECKTLFFAFVFLNPRPEAVGGPSPMLFPWSAPHLVLCMAHGGPSAQSIDK